MNLLSDPAGYLVFIGTVWAVGCLCEEKRKWWWAMGLVHLQILVCANCNSMFLILRYHVQSYLNFSIAQVTASNHRFPGNKDTMITPILLQGIAYTKIICTLQFKLQWETDSTKSWQRFWLPPSFPLLAPFEPFLELMICVNWCQLFNIVRLSSDSCS